MKKMLFTILMLTLCLTGFKNLKTEYKENEIYSTLMQVAECDYENQNYVFCDYLGNEYTFHYDVEQLYETEFYCCTMYCNETSEIYDDIILNIKYQRLDLWKSLETIYEDYNFTGPMGYEMQYIRTISETEMEYRDEQTGVHYIVLNNNTIKSPIFKNVNLDCLKTK